DFNINNVYISYFTMVTQFSGGRYWKGFNEQFDTKYSHVLGNMFKSSEFSDTSDSWAITFSIYNKREVELSKEDALNLTIQMSLEQTKQTVEGVQVEQLGVKTIRKVNDDRGLNRWVRET